MKPWQAQFLAYLGKTANVSAAARFAGQPRSVVYEYRKREAAFAAAWLQALEEAADRLEMEALRWHRRIANACSGRCLTRHHGQDRRR